MAVFAGTRVVKDTSLVLNLDAANIKSVDVQPGIAEHGWSKWICLVGGYYATYAIVNAGVAIYSQSPAGVVSLVVAASTGPTSGLVALTAGYLYYATGGPIFLEVQGAQFAIAPLTMSGTQFFHKAERNQPVQFYLYAPQTTATIYFYDSPPSMGSTSTTVTSITTLPTGAVNTLTASLASWGNFSDVTSGTFYLISTAPIVATAYGTAGGDRTILSPMARTVYNRYPGISNKNIYGTTAATVSSFYISDLFPCMIVTTGDGAGGDCAQGIGLDYMSDTYAHGDQMSDYQIVAPFPNTVVTASYWASTISNWVVWDTNSLSTSASLSSPDSQARDGSTGPGIAATLTNGLASFANTSTLWRWAGNKPFQLIINDIYDEEETMLGWISNTGTTKIVSNNFVWTDIGPNKLVGLGSGSPAPQYSTSGQMPTLSTDNSGYLQLVAGNSPKFQFPVNANLNITNNITIESWINMNSFNNIGGIVTLGTTGAEQYALWTGAGGYLVFSTNWPTNWLQAYSGILSTGTWYHSIVTFSSGNWAHYINSNVSTTGTFTSTNLTTVTNAYLVVGDNHPGGQEYFDGRIGSIKIYNRLLTTDEIQQNYQALRDRYKI
jgi:hypothetical protein